MKIIIILKKRNKKNLKLTKLWEKLLKKIILKIEIYSQVNKNIFKNKVIQ
jgi:hypothetical protein